MQKRHIVILKILIISIWIFLFSLLNYLIFFVASTSFEVLFIERRTYIYWFILLFGILSVLLESKIKNFIITYFLSVYFGYIIAYACAASFIVISLGFGEGLSGYFDLLVYVSLLIFGIFAAFGLYFYFQGNHKLLAFFAVLCFFYYIPFTPFAMMVSMIYERIDFLIFNIPMGGKRAF